MSARSYLSIGDVLTLLRQEFPDVTISKIRFLESQGLVNPERTPSGYRKFYEHDVERLRWVLRQQREHFLPLKVIKDRLDEDAVGVVGDSGTAPGRRGSRAAATTEAPEAAAEEKVAEPVLVGQRASAAPSAGLPSTPAPSAGPPSTPAPSTGPPSTPAPSTGPPSTPAPSTGPDASGLPGIEPPATHLSPPAAAVAPPPAPAERAHHASLATSHTVPDATAANGSGNGVGNHTTPVRASAAREGDPSGAGAEPTGGTGAIPAAATAKAAGKAAAKPSGRPARAAARPAPTAETPADDAAAPAVVGSGGASLSLEELSAASGLSEEYVRQLQEFGLIRSTTVAGAPFYDEEALTVAQVASRFAAFGIEARHLRLYKNAADREAGFIEQVVIPMVRQRNPEARARARQTAGDLAALGQELKASLVRSALSELLNG